VITLDLGQGYGQEVFKVGSMVYVYHHGLGEEVTLVTLVSEDGYNVKMSLDEIARYRVWGQA
jgi:hypothetical protein